MGFLSPWFIAGALAVGIPLYLHLLRRHRTTPQPFSSLMFFEPRTQSSVKHRRLRYLLLLSLRLALILLLALTFANPYLRRSAASANSDKLLLMVIDDSFSMRAGTRLADAKQQALSVIDAKPGAQRAEVMTLGSKLQALTQQTEDKAVLRSAIQGITPGDSHANFGELTREVRSLAGALRAPIDLHLFSDMQKSKTPGNFSELALPENVTLTLHPLVKAPVPNWAVDSVNAPGQVWNPKKTRVQAVIAGFDTPATTKSVSLVINGKTVASQNVAVPANASATVTFPSLDVPYGFSKCAVRIDSSDALPADDTSLFAVQRSDPQNVLFVHEANDSRSAVYFSDALSAGADAAFTVQAASVAQAGNLQLSKYAFVVLSDVASLPSSFESDLLRYVRSGGSVLIAAGTSDGHRARIPVFDVNILAPRDYSRDGASFATVGEADASYPAVAQADKWVGVRFYYALNVDPGDSHVVVKLADGTPLLLDKQMGEGRLELFTSGFDNLTNDFPLHPDFVPFIEQTARYLSGTERHSGSRVVDSLLELRNAKEQGVGVEVVDPDGKRPLSLAEATSAQSYQLPRTGFYEVRLANGRMDVVGVNADRRESDLSPISQDVLNLWRGNAGDPPAQGGAAAATQEAAQPHSIWWYAMLLVFAVALGESLLASRYLGTQREES